MTSAGDIANERTSTTPAMSAAPAKYRPLIFGVTRVVLTTGKNGCQYLQADQPLTQSTARMTDRLLHWAAIAPERSFLARRTRLSDGSSGTWLHLSFGQALAGARSIGQALLDRGLNAERPVLVLSENSLEHAQIALACLYSSVMQAFPIGDLHTALFDGRCQFWRNGDISTLSPSQENARQDWIVKLLPNNCPRCEVAPTRI